LAPAYLHCRFRLPAPAMRARFALSHCAKGDSVAGSGSRTPCAVRRRNGPRHRRVRRRGRLADLRRGWASVAGRGGGGSGRLPADPSRVSADGGLRAGR
jgi:hypothetical protein